ncbi:MAG TPA: HNH endonuclease [Candidatus Acidoferrum sp.]|nr:HNH endonuclease [Candidatus Acidoferrum sp.]
MDRVSPQTCVYCKSHDRLFDREHVMPEAFGTFEPDSPVLDCVCKECNGYFGRSLELALSRDSLEAVLRLRYGVKPASEAKDLRYRKLEVKIGQPGPWLGATAILEADGSGTCVEPVPIPQAGFKWRGGSEFSWIVEREVSAERLAPYKNPPRGTLEIRIVGPSPEDRQRLIEKLGGLGINFDKQGELRQIIPDEDGKVEVRLSSQVDATIFRAIAKIAFNYLAYVHGSSFALQPDFDEVRNYVRYAALPAWGAVVRPSQGPILYDDLPQLRQTNGHLITLNWNMGLRGLLVQVSLFNTTTYHVVLCPAYSGLWRYDIQRGHHFDIESRAVAPLTSTVLIRPF